ncbi:hypothetical protein GJU41_00100 [Bacillus idriensis]|uniref:Uncharacterized protein n=1 Tax=Metabacillus idriensis TaxID=324768 RepID=A0A6I2M6A9_9BACI|nr:hypothetical protein [Metabacillus idriensis]MRX52356.1 hypothetical protein [Metabacillus idriensis]
MEKRYPVSGRFGQEEWNRLSELLEFFNGESIGDVSINDGLKVCVNHTYETFHDFKEMVEEVGHLKSENCKLKNRVKELEEKHKEIKTGIMELNRMILKTEYNSCL